MQNSILLCFKGWILVSQPLSEETLLCIFLPEQKIIEQRLTYDEVMGANLRSVVYPQVILNKADKQFSPSKYNWKTLGKVISFFQSLF